MLFYNFRLRELLLLSVRGKLYTMVCLNVGGTEAVNPSMLILLFTIRPRLRYARVVSLLACAVVLEVVYITLLLF